MLKFKDYQEFTRTTAIYPVQQATEYLLYGLMSEVGEVAALYKRQIRDGEAIDKQVLKKELGDVLWYLTRLADEEGIEMSNAAGMNVAKLMKRQKDDTLKGKGDNR